MDNHTLNKPADIQLEYDAFGKLVLIDRDGTRHAGIEAIRAFPIAAPEQGISLCSAEGDELRWIDSLAQLSDQTRQILEHELASREFVPQIQQVLRMSSATEPSEWTVVTDRGPTTFVLNHEEDVRRLEARRAMIIDAHGIRYIIADLAELDRKSRRILERYL